MLLYKKLLLMTFGTTLVHITIVLLIFQSFSSFLTDKYYLLVAGPLVRNTRQSSVRHTIYLTQFAVPYLCDFY